MGNTASVAYAEGEAAVAEAPEKVEAPAAVSSEEPTVVQTDAGSETSESAEEIAPATSSEESEEVEPEPPMRPKIVLQTHFQLDPRYPATNQAKACFVKYSEYHKCVAEEGEGSEKCESFQRAYRSICPCDWVTRWNELREEGTWFGKF